MQPQMERRYEHCIVDVDVLQGVEQRWIAASEINQWDWRLAGDENLKRLREGKDFLYIALGWAGGSSHKVRKHGSVTPDGSSLEHVIYLHHNKDLPGVLLREVPQGEKVIQVETELVSKFLVSISCHNLAGELVLSLSMPTTERVRASDVMDRLRRKMRGTGLSQYTKLKLVTMQGSTSTLVTPNMLLWSPGWHQPRGARCPPVTRRVIRKTPSIMTMLHFNRRG